MKTYMYGANTTIHCVDTGEVVTGDKYLSSKHWKALRVKAYDYYGGRCQRCGDHIPLDVANVHHRVYKRMGQEQITDLLLYCKHCHACVHKGRKQTHVVNGNLQTLIRILSADERQEAFNVLIKHFNLDVDMIEKEKAEVIRKGKEKHRLKMEKKARQKQNTRKS